MPDTRAQRKVVLATRNPGKLRELAVLLAPLGYEVHPLSDFRAPEVEETAPTFVENALAKARSAAQASGLPAIADDSGIQVDALGGDPGVRSARYAGEAASDESNVQRLLAALRTVPDSQRHARFRCVMVYIAHAQDPSPLICEGVWEGRIAAAPRGEHGFGYDPVFIDPATGRTAAELAPTQKNRVSHRARAVSELVKALGTARA